MRLNTRNVETYRTWANVQPSLCVFWQPAWLDIVAPEAWRVAIARDHKNRITRLWPYVAQERMGLRWATLPLATPYLGPQFSREHGKRTLTLPKDIGYALVTVQDPSLAWQSRLRIRSMATQVLEFTRRPVYDSSLRRLLKQAPKALMFSQTNIQEDEGDIRKLLIARPEVAPLASLPVYIDAVARGLARAWKVCDASGAIEAIAVTPYDRVRAYLTFQLRAHGSHPAAMAYLLDRIISDLNDAGLKSLDFESGYLSGVRRFHARFGAHPEWYGQARLARHIGWRAADFVRAATNPRRL